ncbi:MAG: type II CRISPR-associated endonuclease Cas1 [Ignavibacteria bacterium]|nr:type II CRISPR-associated endonuclease Cas1 [Ignavibacteria bacterium]
MIKRTIYIGNPAYLSKKNDQLIINFIEKDSKDVSEDRIENKAQSIPIEDIGFLILDNFQITVTQSLLISLLENNCAIVTCNDKHMPKGLFFNLEHNIEQSQHFQEQVNASEPLKKQLWQQTIKAKILNQALVLDKYKKPSDNLKKWAREVKSGDTSNLEARASYYYWKKLFPEDLNFVRDREGYPPNNLLNYGYAILRSVVARGLVASGLLPTLGIHHHSKYNAFCLADDIMEPYRPFVDDIVATIIYNGEDFTELSKSIKQQLLQIPAIDVRIENQTRPLMIAVQRTTSSLASCFSGETKKLIYPIFHYENKSI